MKVVLYLLKIVFLGLLREICYEYGTGSYNILRGDCSTVKRRFSWSALPTNKSERFFDLSRMSWHDRFSYPRERHSDFKLYLIERWCYLLILVKLLILKFTSFFTFYWKFVKRSSNRSRKRNRIFDFSLKNFFIPAGKNINRWRWTLWKFWDQVYCKRSKSFHLQPTV